MTTTQPSYFWIPDRWIRLANGDMLFQPGHWRVKS